MTSGWVWFGIAWTLWFLSWRSAAKLKLEYTSLRLRNREREIERMAVERDQLLAAYKGTEQHGGE